MAVAGFIVSTIKAHWILFLLFTFALALALVKGRMNLSPRNQMTARILNVCLYAILIGIIAWIGYRVYQKREYGKLIFGGALLIISAIRDYLRKKVDTQT
jgi:predicted MFS family arabinose efflux permease